MLMFGSGADACAAQMPFGLQPMDRGHRNYHLGRTSRVWLGPCNLWAGSESFRSPFFAPLKRSAIDSNAVHDLLG